MDLPAIIPGLRNQDSLPIAALQIPDDDGWRLISYNCEYLRNFFLLETQESVHYHYIEADIGHTLTHRWVSENIFLIQKTCSRCLYEKSEVYRWKELTSYLTAIIYDNDDRE